MAQKSDESLEDYIERLQYNIQRSDHPDISKEIRKTILLRGLRGDCLNMLNMLAKGDISKESYDEICELAKRCSRGASRNRIRDSTYSRVQKSANGGATRAEIGNLLEEFKTEMLSSFASQIDTLQVKKKRAEGEATLAIYCPKCRDKHPLRECPRDKVPVCTLCEKDHETEQCPSLPGIKAAMQPTEEEAEAVYLLTQRRQWQPKGQGTNSGMPFNHWNNYSAFGQTSYPPFNQMQYPLFSQMNFPPMQMQNPPFVDPSMWTPWPPQQPPPFNPWNPSWNSQSLSYPNQMPQFQQSLSLPSNAPPNNQMRPQLPMQPNPNPNNKVVQVIDIQNQSIFPTMQCNDIHLRSGRIVEPIIDDITSSDSDKSETEKQKEAQPPPNKNVEITEPPFPERLVLTRTAETPAFNFIGELQNLYIKIPLLQALKDVPIYAKTLREICVKKPGRKTKDPLTVHVMGDLSALMSGKTPPVKYGDPGHPMVTVLVGKTIVLRVLLDLGADINITTLETTQLKNVIIETPTILELVDRSRIKPEGVIEDLIISVESWNYPADLFVLQTKAKLGGHPLILGRPWLATTDAFISCRSSNMYISDANSTKKFTIYPPGRTIMEIDDKEWNDDENDIQPLFTISTISEDSQILNTMENFESSLEYEHDQFQEKSNIEYLSSR